MPVVQAFDVGQYGLCAAREGFELRGRERTVGAVPHGHHEHVHRVVGINGLQAEAVFALHFVGIGHGVAHHHLHAPVLKFAHHVHDLAIADVGAVLFESDAQHAHGAAWRIHTLAQHQLDGAARSVAAHVVVDAAARQNDLRVQDLLTILKDLEEDKVVVKEGLLQEVIRVLNQDLVILPK